MRELTQEEIQKAIQKSFNNQLVVLMQDTEEASRKIQAVLQGLQNKYERLEFNVDIQQSKSMLEISHMCFIGVKLI